MSSEAYVKKCIREYLDTLDGCEHFPYNPRFGKAGVGDRIVCWHGLFIGIEAKGDRGKPTKLQMEWRDRVIKAGGIHILAYHVDDVKAFFERAQKSETYIMEYFRNQIKGVI